MSTPTAAESGALLKVHDISIEFGGVKALSDIRFDVHRREIFAIIGPNGAGKSSLLNTLTGIYRPSAGSVSCDGHPIIGQSPAAIAGLGVARTFQNLGLFESLTVLDNLLVGYDTKMSGGIIAGVIWRPLARRQEVAAREHCERVIEQLELDDYRTAVVGDLPYGVKKRVELAKALAAKPKILLLDEPVAGMNPEESSRIAQTIEVARSTFNTTIVLIEHDLAMVMKLADSVLVLDFGRVVACGTPAQIQSDPEVLLAYTGGVGVPTPPHDHETPVTP